LPLGFSEGFALAFPLLPAVVGFLVTVGFLVVGFLVGVGFLVTVGFLVGCRVGPRVGFCFFVRSVNKSERHFEFVGK
jgi:hypothetical protein